MLLDVYGNAKEYTGEKCFVPFRYQGHYEDKETHQYYNRFRYYSPKMGMYISSDPLDWRVVILRYTDMFSTPIHRLTHLDWIVTK